MAEMQCILGTELVSEKEKLKKDLFKGKALDVLIYLLGGEKTTSDIAENLDVSVFSIKLYLNRLMRANLIIESKVKKENGYIEKSYKLASENLDIINEHMTDINNEDSKKLECEIMACHFSKLIDNSIRNLYKNNEKPYLVKSCFIKADRENMLEFQRRLSELFDEFNSMENLDAKDTYTFISTFSSYDVD